MSPLAVPSEAADIMIIIVITMNTMSDEFEGSATKMEMAMIDT